MIEPVQAGWAMKMITGGGLLWIGRTIRSAREERSGRTPDRIAKEVKMPKPTLLAIAMSGMLALDPGSAGSTDPRPAGTPAAQAPAPVKTGKERLSDKASDEQRVDNCNVPPDRRGTKMRPHQCAGEQHRVPTN